MDYVPTLTLIPSISLFLSPLSLPFFPLYCFHSPSFSRSPSFGLMAYTCQQSGRGTAMTKWNAPVLRAMLFLPGLDHNVLLTVHNPNSLPTHLSKPHYQDPHSSVALPALCNCRLLSLRKTFGFLMHISLALGDRYRSYVSVLKIEPPTKAIIASSKMFLQSHGVCN